MVRTAPVVSLLVVAACATFPTRARAEDPVSKPAPPPAAHPRPTNRLAGERSPYLRQHQHNPVDWRPWGPEAFAAAKEQGKLVFLSIGYSACHWCHVMEHESFEDDAVAKVLNDAFVCVKVDREERPDVDDVYMSAVQLTTGRGGWPMSVFLLPDGRPFLARTYMRPQDVVSITKRILEMARDDRPRLLAAAEEISKGVREQAAGPKLPPFQGSDAELIAAALERVSGEFDDVHGGFDRSPKFPPHATLLFLLDEAGTRGGVRGLEMAVKTLDGMAAGGVHDRLGGGFHRYATDERWFLPHFEKMLYDNALLASAYAKAFAATQDPRHAKVVRDLFAWIEREMRVDGGGVASSLDADTQGEEGLTYTWTLDELRAALPASDLAIAVEAWGVTAEGNAHDEASGRPTGRNILHLPAPLAPLAARRGTSLAEVEATLERCRATLRPLRDRRAQPPRDGKVLTAWNALLVSAYATASVALSEPLYLERAKELAAFLQSKSMVDGALLRFPADSGPRIPGFLDDHAHLADALLELAQATGDERYAAQAAVLADAILARFSDPSGRLHSSSTEHETLLTRGTDAYDSPIPSGNATAARVLLRLYARGREPARLAAAERILAAHRPLMARAPTGTMALVRALADHLALLRSGERTGAGDVTVRRGVATIDAFLDRAEAKAGSTVRIAVRLALATGWHVNADPASRPELIPTTLTLGPKAPGTLGAVERPKVHVVSGPKPTDAVSVYEGECWFRTTLTLPADTPAGPRRVSLLLTFQPCDATTCAPTETVALDLALRVGDEGPIRHPTVFR